MDVWGTKMARREERGNSPELEKIRGKVLLIGGTGTVGFGLGQGLRKCLGEESVAIGGRQATEGNPQSLRLDALDKESLKRAIERATPGLIVHLAAETNVNRCEQEPEWARRLNVEGAKNVIEAAGSIPVIYFSTDFVFSGETSELKRETDQPDPISIYGQTKYEGELALLESGNPGGIIRISFPWYPVSDHLVSARITDSLWWMRNTLLKGEDVPAFTNVSASWTSMARLEQDFWRIVGVMQGNGIKILHLAGETPATPYQVAMAVRARLIKAGESQERLGRVIGVEFKAESGKTAPRPEKGGLNSSLARSLGWNQPGILEMIEEGEWL